MAKAILELPEMPVGCETCPIKRYNWVEYICGIIGEEIANKGRRSDCPLKLVRGRRLKGYEVDTIEALQAENEQLQEFANAKAEGRLVVLLPIDTEVFIVQDGEILGFRIYEYSLFSTNNLNIRYWSECITDDDEDDLDFWADDIGVAVFLTREEAEKALGGGEE